MSEPMFGLEEIVPWADAPTIEAELARGLSGTPDKILERAMRREWNSHTHWHQEVRMTAGPCPVCGGAA